MTVAWRSALGYALVVAVGSWGVGVMVDLGWVVVAKCLGQWVTWSTVAVTDPRTYVFPVVATLVLVLARRLSAPMPVWRVPLIDGGAYLLVLLVCAGLLAWWDGAPVPVDDAFVAAVVALFTLQLPAAWVLSFWRAQHLRVVLGRGGGDPAATWFAGP
ncbi:hypothetical protein [Streptomyces sp. NPDC057702]|uniref:hypothetical protein n=1 Tax=unclassified Streptomyces TaxID=2593676 RepID=UPI0036BCDF1F